jgi:drug/metabolite transporter (DMT)-like permease
MSRRFLRSVVVLGVLDGIAPYLLMAYGQVHVTSALAAIFVSTMPLFTTVFAMWSSRERTAGPASVIGVAGGFAGVAVLAGPGSLQSGAGDSAAMLAMLLAAACYAAATVYARGPREIASPIALTAGKLTVAAAVVVPLAVTIDGTGNFESLSTEAWLSVAALGLGSTGLGRVLYLWSVGKAGSVKASLVTYIAPVVAIILGWAVLGEQIELRMLVGAALIGTGVVSVMFGRHLEALLREAFGRKPVGLAPRVES